MCVCVGCEMGWEKGGLRGEGGRMGSLKVGKREMKGSKCRGKENRSSESGGTRYIKDIS